MDGNNNVGRPRSSGILEKYTIEEVEINGQMTRRAICKFCGRNYSVKIESGTAHLRRHYERCKKEHEDAAN